MKKLLVFAGIVVVICVLILLGRQGRRAPIVQVELQPTGAQSIRASILASGRIAYDDQVTLTSEIVGIVERTLVKEGERVSKGQPLLEIRADEYTATVDQQMAEVTIRSAEVERARLNLRRHRQQSERARRLYPGRLISKDAFEQSVLDYDVAEVELKHSIAAQSQAQASLAQARNRLAKTRIYSPIDGVVVSLDIKGGETAIPSVGGIAGSTLMVIADPASIYVEVNVDEADIGKVAIGDEAEVVAVAFSLQPLKGKLYSMANTARVAPGRQGLSFAVKIRPEVANGTHLRSGMSCRTEIYSTSKKAVLAAPIRAVLAEEDRVANKTSYYVFVNRDDIAVKVPVEVGVSDDDNQEIVRGLSAGDRVVVGPDRALRDLKDGDTIEAVSSGDADP
jgi:HlyD family secretion protein